MAIISYSDFFDRLKEIVRAFYTLDKMQTTTKRRLGLQTIRDQLLTPFESQDKIGPVSDIQNIFARQINNTTDLKRSLVAACESLLIEVGEDLGVSAANDVDSILDAIIEAMIKDGQTIAAREIEIEGTDLDGSDSTLIYADSGNNGDGVLGYTFRRPDSDYTNQIARTGYIVCRCTAANTAGQETFQLFGAEEKQPQEPSPLGPGRGPVLNPGVDRLISNGDFENWTDSAADDWTSNTSVFAWGTELLQEQSTVLRGDSALEIAHDGDEGHIYATVSLQQGKLYGLGVWARKAASATGTITITLRDENGDQLGSDSLTIDISTLSSSAWSFNWAVFETPRTAFTSTTVRVAVSSLATANSFLDAIQLVEMTEFNGCHYALFAGASDFAVNDKFGKYVNGRGFKLQEKPLRDDLLTAGTPSTITRAVIESTNVVAYFPKGCYVYHSADDWDYLIGSVTFDSPHTLVYFTDTAAHSWASQKLQAVRNCLIQRFLAHAFEKMLPNTTDGFTITDP
jgi:hypothetical protein